MKLINNLLNSVMLVTYLSFIGLIVISLWYALILVVTDFLKTF